MGILTPEEARAFYDRFGARQDRQAFYENPALAALVAHADFEHASRVFEFGCGTGRFGARLLRAHLPARAVYEGVDLSGTMIELSRKRLAPFAPRASVRQGDGPVRFGLSPGSVDRVVSTYVLDLLPEPEIRAFFGEAHRALRPGGRVCLVSLTRADAWPSRLVLGAWNGLFRLHPRLVGGCRPVELLEFLDSSAWRPLFRQIITAFGIPSEVLVARPA